MCVSIEIFSKNTAETRRKHHRAGFCAAAGITEDCVQARKLSR